MQDFGKRTDALSKLDLFIDLCESDISRALRVTEMDATDTGATSTSVRYVSLPSRCLDLRQILITIDGHQYEMDYKNINDMFIHSSSAAPTEYTITNRIEFNRISDQSYTLTYQFYQAPEPLSSSVGSNVVLDGYPIIYLSGCMKHFYKWSREDQESLYWKAIFDEEVAKANVESCYRRHPSGLSVSFHGGMIV